MNKHSYLKYICLIVVIIIAAATTICLANGIDDRFLRSIKDSGYYYFGEGHDQTEEVARRQAKVRLLESITVAISSTTMDISREINFEVSEDYENVLLTYSSLSLQNLQTRTDQNRDGWYALSYISKSDLEDSFAQAKQNVRDMVKLALQAESEGRIGDALKRLYWAYLLTHTYVGELKLGLDEIDVADARMAIERKMEKVGSNLSITAAPCVRSAGSSTTTLAFSHNGKPVQNLDFSYYCGEGDDQICISNGEKAYITIYKELTQRRVPLPLRIEYVYAGEMRSQPEVLNLYKIFKDKSIDLFVTVDLIMPWIPKERIEQPRKAQKTPVITILLPKPAPRDWSYSIQVLADISDKHEFQKELTKLKDTGQLYSANDLSQLSASDRHYLALYCDQIVTALLYFDGNKYKNVRTGREYADYKVILPTESEVSGTWIGEVNK